MPPTSRVSTQITDISPIQEHPQTSPPIPIDRLELACLAMEVLQYIQLPKLDSSVLDKLAIYLAMLVQWNSAFNLVGFHHWREIFTHLVADSLYLADFLTRFPLAATSRIWDLGSGAGLPGIPLRLIWTQGEYYMIERREKRALFISTALARLMPERTSVFRGSAEKFFAARTAVREKADGIVSRAFRPWPELLDLVQPCLAPEGKLIILASQKIPTKLPHPWLPTDTYSYKIAGKKRFFWSLTLPGV